MHDLILEASWVGMQIGLEKRESVELASTKLEQILGLPASGDFVIWEGNPFDHGGSVVLAFSPVDLKQSTEKFKVSSCWPDELRHL